MKKKILIAEDNEDIRLLIKRTLEFEEAYELFEAKDGDEALARAIEIKPDLLLLDIMMPGMSGYEVCRELKNDSGTKHIIIVFVTARGGSEIAKMTIASKGGDGLIEKPFVPEAMAFKVKRYLGS